MSLSTITRAPATAGPAERAALTALLTEEESQISGAPVYSPQAHGALLLLVLLSPKQPTEPRDR